jgi:glutamine amidotransferase
MGSNQSLVVVIDYGMGNVGSVLNMLRKVGCNAILSSGAEDLLRADRLILPGVGSFDAGMTNLKERGYIELLNDQVLRNKIPILGICLGMQLMTKRSEEGAISGLGWLDSETIKFRDLPSAMKVPHMGWDYVQMTKSSPLFPNTQQEPRFYFVHSYYVSCNNPDDVLTTTLYDKDFVSSFCHNNILGAQFHPEKSHRFGFEFLCNFLKWNPNVSGQIST